MNKKELLEKYEEAMQTIIDRLSEINCEIIDLKQDLLLEQGMCREEINKNG